MTETLERTHPGVGQQVTTLDQMLALPVGTVIEHGDRGRYLYRKVDADGWQRATAGAGSTRYVSRNFGAPTVGNNTVVVTLPEPTFVVGQALTTREQLLALPIGSVMSHSGMHCTKTADGRWEDVENGDYTVESFIAGNGSVPATTLVSLTSNPVPDDVEARIQAAVAAAVETERAARVQETQRQTASVTRLEQGIERLNDALLDAAANWDRESEMDELLNDFTNIGMHPGERDYDVEYTITVKHVHTVTARNPDDAEDAANDATGFYEGQSTELYGENVEITSISTDVEEA